jgi:hypothetical protein
MKLKFAIEISWVKKKLTSIFEIYIFLKLLTKSKENSKRIVKKKNNNIIIYAKKKNIL